ncbi:MAG TPA: TrmH family RNA methyltransferase [Candidatus Paceibacterota bacterium]|nr:TrmH family RNA methyltransferase [Candidatus Paceibacterota bacterium]
MSKINSILILHNIRSVLNVGAIFRTADAVGISKIYLSGYTPTPIDRFGRERSDFKKSALGAEKNVPWEFLEHDVLQTIDNLKKQNYKIISLEQSNSSIDYKKIKLNDIDHVAIIVGNEVSGIEKEILESSDIVAEIPMSGKKESLNVSVATGVFLFRLLDK